MFQLALAISAVLGSVIASWSFALIMWLSVISQVICLILSFLLIEPKFHSKKSGNIFAHLQQATSYFITNRKLRLLSIASIIGNSVGEASYYFQSAFYNTLWPIWAIGIAKTMSNLGATLSFRVSGKILRKHSSIKMLFASSIYNRIINIISTGFPTVLSPLLMSTTSLFYGITEVAKSTLLQKEFKDEQRATMGSLNSFFGSIFFSIVAFALGFMADKLSPASALLILQIISFSIVWLYWELFKHDKHEKVDTANLATTKA